MAYQFSNPKSRPTSSTGPQTPPAAKASRPKSGIMRNLVTLIILIIIIGGGIYLISSYTSISLPGGGSLDLNNDWQAVFLSNGQVYFGQVKSVNSDWLILGNIYYLQVVNQPLQRSQEGDDAAAPQDQQQQEQRLTLIKLGNEIHGPRDEMAINHRHVVLVEDLRSDGRVVQAINEYVNQQQNQQNQPTQ